MIKDSVYLVTGGASGLGKATVEHLLAKGAKVVSCDISVVNTKEVVSKDGENNIVYVKADVTSEEDISRTLQITEEKFGKLNGVINCAGIFEGYLTYDFETNQPHSLESFTRVLMVNTVGTFNIIRLAAGLISKNDLDKNGERGIIINTASVAGLDGKTHRAAYSASKAAIVGMTMPLAKDLAEKQIRVVTIAPGGFDTPIIPQMNEVQWQGFKQCLTFPKRMGEPQEFAEFVEVVIGTPMLNATTIRLDAGGRFFF